MLVIIKILRDIVCVSFGDVVYIIIGNNLKCWNDFSGVSEGFSFVEWSNY